MNLFKDNQQTDKEQTCRVSKQIQLTVLMYLDNALSKVLCWSAVHKQKGTVLYLIWTADSKRSEH